MRYRVVIRRHGVSGGAPGPGGKPGKRGKVGGWSSGAASRNAHWLQSVTPPDGLGIALTLTLKEVVSAAEWRNILGAFTRALSRCKNVIAWHYVVEWQKRGVPHVHFAVYVDANNEAWETYMTMFRRWWVDISANAEMQSQHARAINSYVGWLEYVAKHGARGVRHYQREVVPVDWIGDSTGRMWGYGGRWPAHKVGNLSLSRSDYVRFCRVLRRYMVSRGRPRRVVRLVNDKTRGFPRGVMEWVPVAITLRLVEWLLSFSDSDVSYLSSE